MRYSIRLSIGATAIAALAACSGTKQAPMSDDLKQDLARVGGGDMQLAGAASPRLAVVSASERTLSPTPAPHAPSISRAPSAMRGSRAVVRSARHVSPAAAEPTPRAAETAPAESPRAEQAPEPVPAAAGRPHAPQPSTQREPRGGWKTMGDIIRNAPFPINP